MGSESGRRVPATLYGSMRIDRRALAAEAERLGLTGQQLGALLLANCIVRGDPSPRRAGGRPALDRAPEEDPGGDY